MIDLERLRKEYRDALLNLTFNSRPIIMELTMKAQENMKGSPAIAEAILEQLDTVHPPFKLPILYLMDSILKNVGGQYLVLFEGRIVDVFIKVWNSVDNTIKEKMVKLLETWRKNPTTRTMVFEEKVLVALETFVESHWNVVKNTLPLMKIPNVQPSVPSAVPVIPTSIPVQIVSKQRVISRPSRLLLCL